MVSVITLDKITVVRTNKGHTNKGQITFLIKIYWVLIRDKYLENNFHQAKYCRFFISTDYFRGNAQFTDRLM